MPDAAQMQPYQVGGTFASTWYMQKEDNLRLTSYNALASVKLEVRYRFLDQANVLIPNQETQTPNTDRTAKQSIFITPEGWLLGGEVFVSGAAPLIGQTYVVLEIVRGVSASALPLQVIAAGYVSAKQPLPFPGTQIGSSLDGGGALRSIVGSAPAAGAEISETVPTGARWELLMFRAAYTTSATAGNRQPILILDDGSNRWMTSPYLGVTAASGSGAAEWAQGSNIGATVGGQNPAGFIPLNNRLPAGARIRTTTVSIAAGDQYAAPTYLVREWLEGA